jgi:hypothetical protein
MQGSQISNLTFNFKGSIIKLISLETRSTGNLHFKKDTFERFINYDIELLKNCITEDYKSYYSSSAIEIFNKYNKGGFIGSTHNFECKMAYEIDFKKYYTSILYDMPNIPVFNTFDGFQEYTGGEIENMSIYLCESLLNGVNIYLSDKFNIYYGHNLKTIDRKYYKIISYIKPYKIVDNNIKHHIEKIYNSEMTTEEKKFIINKLIGLIGKRYNKKEYTTIYEDKKQAYMSMKKQGGQIITLHYDSKFSLYLHIIRHKRELIDGYYPIQLYIYDTARLRLNKLTNLLIDSGNKILGWRTDCAYIEHNKESLNKFIENNKDIIYNGEKDIKQFNKVSIDDKLLNSMNKITQKKNLLHDIKKIDAEINNIKIVDEWDYKTIVKQVEDVKRLLITADTAGGGKTFLSSEIAKHRGDYIYVTPWNTQRQNLIRSKHNAVTYNSFFSLVYDSNTNKNENSKAKFNYKKYDTIIFDEIYLYNPDQLIKISNFCKNNEDKYIIANGDLFQNKPIGNYNKDDKKYYDDIIKSIFNNNIHLTVNKRIKDNSLRLKYADGLNKIRNSETVDEAIKYAHKIFKTTKAITNNKNVSYFNSTSEIVNKYRHLKVMTHNKKKNIFYKGLKVICNKTIINKKIRTYKNFEYEVIEISKDNITITDYDNNLTLEIKYFKSNEYFRLPYCQTCHSLQGLGIDENITIYDLNNNNKRLTVEWIYTALTRNSDPTKIKIFNGSLEKFK